jgi:hypothetical protein
MPLLALLLAIDAALHALLVYRFGIKENMKFFVYVFIDAALAVAVLLDLPYALWLALVLSVIGIVGLTVTFNQPSGTRQSTREFGWQIWQPSSVRFTCCSFDSERA